MTQETRIGNCIRIPDRLKPAIVLLNEAAEYARLTDCDRWEYAVEIKQLRKLGLSPNDLRLLVRANIADHGTEIILKGQNGRKFQSTGDLTFTKKTCFVLLPKCDANEDEICQTLFQIGAASSASSNSIHDSFQVQNGKEKVQIPSWDKVKRILIFYGQVVKQFKWPAVNQESILGAFQEEGWPVRIDDPITPHPNQDSKRRLSDTIKCLNRKQKSPMIHFRGDGTGEGVFWEATSSRNSVES